MLPPIGIDNFSVFGVESYRTADLDQLEVSPVAPSW